MSEECRTIEADKQQEVLYLLADIRIAQLAEQHSSQHVASCWLLTEHPLTMSTPSHNALEYSHLGLSRHDSKLLVLWITNDNDIRFQDQIPYNLCRSIPSNTSCNHTGKWWEAAKYYLEMCLINSKAISLTAWPEEAYNNHKLLLFLFLSPFIPSYLSVNFEETQNSLLSTVKDCSFKGGSFAVTFLLIYLQKLYKPSDYHIVAYFLFLWHKLEKICWAGLNFIHWELKSRVLKTEV